jgi:Cof subfamily protein (haloacid dehalogenase superfamily)
VIKALILDIDGTIVGEKVGVNTRNPHSDVMNAMKRISSKGIPICLCTARPHFSIPEIIKGANLANPHITDGGAVIIDPIDNVVVEEHTIPNDLAIKVLQTCLDNNIYVEFYTVDDYFLQESQFSETTEKHSIVIQRKPTIVNSLLEKAKKSAITKIMPVPENAEHRKKTAKILEPFESQLSIGWSIHPVALPRQFGVITAKGISKKEAAKKVANTLKIPLENFLAVGDTVSDWSFIQLCGYGATLKNGGSDIQELIKSMSKGKSFIAPHVDENGILDVFKNFLL